MLFSKKILIPIIIFILITAISAYLLLNALATNRQIDSDLSLPSSADFFAEIKSISPRQSVSLPLIISGNANVFADIMIIEFKDPSGHALLKDFVNIGGEKSANEGEFSYWLNSIPFLSSPDNADNNLSDTVPLVVNLYSEDPLNGREIKLFSLPFSLSKEGFNPISLFVSSPQSLSDCSAVSPVFRALPVYQNESDYLQKSLNMLASVVLTPPEKNKGLFSDLPGNIFLESVSLSESESSNEAVVILSESALSLSDECRLQSIRSQISATALQFPDVDSVSVYISAPEGNIKI